MKKQSFIVCRHLLRFPLVKDAHDYLKRHDAQQLHLSLNSEGGADIFSIVGRCQWQQNALALLTKLTADNPENHFHLFTESEG